MTAEPSTTTATTRPAAAQPFLLRMTGYLAPRFGAPGSISSAVAALRHTRRPRS